MASLKSCHKSDLININPPLWFCEIWKTTIFFKKNLQEGLIINLIEILEARRLKVFSSKLSSQCARNINVADKRSLSQEKKAKYLQTGLTVTLSELNLKFKL